MTDTTDTGAEAGGAEAPARGTPEYNQMMAEKYDNQGGRVDPNKQNFENLQEAAKPDYGMDKFWNSETGDYDHANHIKELNYRLDQAKVGQGEGNFTPINFEEVWTSVAETGELNEQYKEAFTKVGIPPEIVTQFMELNQQAAQMQAQISTTYAGGQEALDGMFEWAKNNLPAEEIDAYNETLAGPNWRMALDSLKERTGMGKAAPQQPGMKLVDDTAPAGPSSTAFASKNEMVKAMSDPRYREDPDYRDQVRKRVALSNF
ncbi:capsid assembly protein [Roseibium alexandrii]|uniref:Capsid assembly protein n=1 Tax=Roseibium alexandrii (strain DSM 17067 / NCIMB 14079 / DFL-11) TaxID=244592 RepID=A0A5E8GTH4_ROSAD|nr:hypothetical protein [Roseibium alexandrii]EEE42853.1 hypothetical protein SADFL11_PLAS25 [Roseibium alexandrii DFL-11]